MINGELGDYIRSRRDQVRPGDVGLPESLRRRTPGLRRAELATLAGISVDYLTRLEQGRDARPSTQVLAAIADALRLGDADRAHLQELATISQGTELCARASADRARRTVRPPVRTILDHLDPAPAAVVDHLGDLLAWNEGYDQMTRPIGLLEQATDHPPNLLRYTFTHPQAHVFFPDWGDIADRQVARLYQLRHGNPLVDVLAAELAREAGPAFIDRWNARPLPSGTEAVTCLEHPTVGTLRLTVETLNLSSVEHTSVLVYLPADAATAAGLDRLSGRRPGGLRSISG